ncbi:MAG: DUF3320 domain-containing protein [Candidatus Omnitrophota bacterium]
MKNDSSKISKMKLQIEEWKKRLIDLTRRNQLVFFNSTKKSTIEIKHPSFEDVFSSLFNEKKFSVWLPPKDDENNKLSDSEKEDLFNSSPADDDEYNLRDNELAFVLSERKETERRIKSIYRKASSDYLEKGIRTSIVAFGLLWWKEKDSHEEVCSPLLLYSVEILQATPEEPYKILGSEEDVILNPAIQVKMNWDFKIQLPEPDFDSDDWNLDAYLSSIEKLGKRDGWRVEKRMFLGNFSFHKIAMYQDLAVNASIMEQHLIIKGLAEGFLDERLCVNDIPNEKELDNNADSKRMLYILDADSSQSKAIESSICGHSFVLKGPPGTGKSQTISNIIAEFLEEGKTVLFVSEKMAALEVVFNRLKQARLTDYCLELHSHKANKKEVVKELKRCLDEQPIANKKVTSLELEKLRALRTRLNEYVLELHFVRDPLGESMYQVFGKLSRLDRMTLIPIKLPDDSFSPISFQSMKDLISRLRNCFIVIEEGRVFPWRGFKPQRFTHSLRADLIDKLTKIRSQISKLDGLFKDHSSILGLDSPVSLSGCKWMLQMSRKLTNNPSPVKLWFSEIERKQLLLEAQKYCDLDERYQLLRNEVLGDFNETFFGLTVSIKNDFQSVWGDLSALISKDAGMDAQLLVVRKELEAFSDSSRQYLEGYIRDVREIKEAFGLTIPENYSIERIKQLTELVSLLFVENKPEKAWFDPVALNRAVNMIKKLRVYCEKYSQLTTEIASKYYTGFLTLDTERLIKNFEGRYKSIFRFFIPGYYFDISRIKKISKTKSFLATIVTDLRNVRELKELENTFNVESPSIKEALGNYFNGFDTNLEATEFAIETADKIIRLVGELPLPVGVLNAGAFGGIAHPNLKIISSRLHNTLTVWLRELEKFGIIVSDKCLMVTKLPLVESSVVSLNQYFYDLSLALKNLNIVVNAIEQPKRVGHFNSCSEIFEKLDSLAQIRDFEKDIQGRSEKLSQSFGNKFLGLQTNWREIVNALNWTKEFTGMIEGVPLSDDFLANVISGIRPKESEISELDSERQTAENRIKEFEELFNDKEDQFPPVRLENLDFDHITMDLDQLISRIDDLSYWLEYINIAGELRKYGLSSFIEKIVAIPPNPDQLGDIFVKSFYNAWVNKVSEQVPVLGEFKGINHEDTVTEFRALDKKLNSLSSSLIIEKLNESKSGLLDGVRGSEVSVLRDQSARVRRHFPLRVLFSRIPHLLLKLKPCLLMSPLSVSHFIDQTNYKFDLVIFDEASQICSEDAVGAIARGKQLIVAGDNKQLPPTKFFQGDSTDEDDIEESNESFGVYQSVLDDCERIGLTPQPLMLKWHYRSKHEGLIAYSNLRFYENKLVTFPCAKEKHDDLGIKFIYVSDGVFDRGGKRNNLKEAEIVADLVFDHLTKYGDSKTLGVATLNLPQKDAVLDAIEQRRKIHPELDKFFLTDRLSGFFVKNLESVQGDERDVIILSLGYGRDSQGRFTMNFGPINKDGGEKRLNVIVTRAKEKLILVSSIKASDFDLSNLNTEGVRHLYRYLDYAERGKEALELQDITDGDVDSPFEEDVKNAIRAFGFDAVSQVGCSGFRIDIGVIDPAHPGCFILGVECDGATYHSAFTARERDRIRQEILEKLGWKMHRIWSPDWFYRKAEEIAKLKEVIDKVRTNGYCSGVSHKSHEIEIRYDKREPNDFKENFVDGIVEYSIYKRRNTYPSYEFNLPESCEKRADILVEIVRHESPIHVDLVSRRLLSIWGIQRMGSVVEDTMDRTVRYCLRKEYIFRKGKFLYSDSLFVVNNVRKPIEGKPETFRDAELISEDEVELALTLFIKNAMSIDKEALITETARLFGWARNGSKVESLIVKAFGELLKKELIVTNNNLVYLKTN